MHASGKSAQAHSLLAACHSNRLPTFRALRNRNFRRLWIGLALSAAGTWMQIVALGLLVLEVTHGSAVALGTVALAQALSFLLFALERQEPGAALQIFKATPGSVAACGVGHLAVRP